MQQTLEAAQRDLSNQVYEQFSAMTEGVLRIAALEQAVRSAQQALLSSQKSLQAGARTTVDVLNAEQQLTVAQRDLAQARYGYVLAHLKLQMLAGQERMANVDAVNRWLKTQGEASAVAATSLSPGTFSGSLSAPSVPRMAVLLAAYNGMAWLQQQVQSILAQQGVQVALFISVDASTDGTRAWVQALSQAEPAVTLLPDAGRLGSAGANFFICCARWTAPPLMRWRLPTKTIFGCQISCSGPGSAWPLEPARCIPRMCWRFGTMGAAS